MKTYILILFLSASKFDNAGVGLIAQEFNSMAACTKAGMIMVQKYMAQPNRPIADFGCFEK